MLEFIKGLLEFTRLAWVFTIPMGLVLIFSLLMVIRDKNLVRRKRLKKSGQLKW